MITVNNLWFCLYFSISHDVLETLCSFSRLLVVVYDSSEGKQATIYVNIMYALFSLISFKSLLHSIFE